MSARITIQSGIAAGTSHRIEGRVARIGSDPKSDVCLPTADVPGHALTLEFRGDGCLVYNRCQQNIYIGAQVVEPDDAVEWPETDILQLGPNIELLLDFEDSDTPCLDSADEYEIDPEETISAAPDSDPSERKQGKASSTSTKTALQVGITILCLAGCALLLIRDQNRKSTPVSGPGFSEIISTAIATPGISSELIQRLQHAEAQRVRGRLDTAEEEYQSIRDDLVAELDEPCSASGELNSEILRFIQTRLAKGANP
jgi:hypothetical protein